MRLGNPPIPLKKKRKSARLTKVTRFGNEPGGGHGFATGLPLYDQTNEGTLERQKSTGFSNAPSRSSTRSSGSGCDNYSYPLLPYSALERFSSPELSRLSLTKPVRYDDSFKRKSRRTVWYNSSQRLSAFPCTEELEAGDSRPQEPGKSLGPMQLTSTADNSNQTGGPVVTQCPDEQYEKYRSTNHAVELKRLGIATAPMPPAQVVPHYLREVVTELPKESTGNSWRNGLRKSVRKSVGKKSSAQPSVSKTNTEIRISARSANNPFMPQTVTATDLMGGTGIAQAGGNRTLNEFEQQRLRVQRSKRQRRCLWKTLLVVFVVILLLVITLGIIYATTPELLDQLF